MSKTMVLPGTKWQIPLIQKLNTLGHNVFLVNPIKVSGVYELSDNFLLSDIFDIDALEQYAKENAIEAIISDECDIAMPVIAELGKRLNLHTLSCDTAALFTNKMFMKEFCKTIGLKTAEYKLCENEEEVVSFLKSIGKPVIIKPIDSNASHGVVKIETKQDIYEHFHETLSFSRSKKAVLAERYISGTEFTVDGVKTPDNHYTLAISEKKHYKHNDNIANELFFTHSSLKYDYERLKKTNDSFVLNSPLLFGLTHAEYKYENGEFYLIEIAARGGGNLISSVITRHMSGYDTYDYLINCSLGKITSPNFDISEEFKDRAAVLKFFEIPHGGVVQDICGIDYLQNEKDIVSFAINCKKGEQIEVAKNDSERIGYYIACADSKDELINVMDIIEDHFEIIVR